MRKAKILISGMHCASCASNVQKSLSRVPGVKTSSVNLIMKKGYCELEENVTDDELKKAVRRAGYTATSVEFE